VRVALKARWLVHDYGINRIILGIRLLPSRFLEIQIGSLIPRIADLSDLPLGKLSWLYCNPRFFADRDKID
jgi:hypothetical protein